MNYLLIENLRRYDYFFGESLKVECPTGSGKLMRLTDVAHELSVRLSKLFYPSPEGFRPCHGKSYDTRLNRHDLDVQLSLSLTFTGENN